MGKKYKVELTEDQMRVVQKCTELYVRCMLGQPHDLADELTFGTVTFPEDEDEKGKVIDRTLYKKNAIYEMLRAVFRVAFPNGYGTPDEKTEDCMIAECIWDAVRFARGKSRWSEPFQIGGEPVPKIEVIDDGE